MWVFTKEDSIQVNTFNGYDVKCSMFTVSVAANVIAHSILSQDMVDRRIDSKIVDRLVQNFELLRDVGYALSERTHFARIID
ncbi:hypothetical protein D3C81_2013360 [compost metagenome]